MYRFITVTTLLIALLAFPSIADAQPRQRLVTPVATSFGSVTGEWTMRLAPLLDASMEGQAIELQATLLEIDGTILGRAGFLTLQGIRSGNMIDLEVHQVGQEQRDQVATIRMTIESSELMRGPAVHLVMEEGAPFAVDHVTFMRPRGSSMAVSSDALDFDFDPALIAAPESLVGDLCGMVVGQITSTFTGGWFVPMNACNPKINGGGYYLTGDVGPGARFFGTTTMYVPVELAACSSRKYSFTLRNQGPTTWSKIVDWLVTDSAGKQIWSRLTAGNIAITQLENLYTKVGDFAVLLGYSTKSHNATLYILNPNGNCSAIQNDPLVVAAKNAVSGIMPHLGNLEVICGGSEVSDTWQLNRSPSPSAGACNTPVVFVYLIGNLDVKID
ncbi:MAG: hypothetical protein ABR517_00620 [Thermoanaerobaculia bacterium]